MNRDWYDQLADAVHGLAEMSAQGGMGARCADLALTRAADLTESPAGYICWEYDRRQEPVCLASRGQGLGLKQNGQRTVLPRSHPLWRAMESRPLPMLGDDASPRLEDPPDALDGRPWLSLPMTTGGRLRGQMTLAGAPGGYGRREMAAAAALAGVCAGALKRSPEADTEQFFSYPQLRAIFEHAPVGICFGNAKGRFLRVNQRFADMLGYSREELAGMRFQEVTHPEDLGLQERERGLLWNGSQPEYRIEKRYLRRDGRVIWCHLTVSALVDDQGKPTTILGICEDISARRRAERERRLSETEKAVILDAINEVVVFLDTGNRVVWGNRTAADLVGLAPEDIKGRLCHELWHLREEPCPDCPVRRSMDSGRLEEGLVAMPDGRQFTLKSYPIHGEQGELLGAVQLAQDITAQRAAEQALKTSEERFRTLVQNLPGTVYRCELEYPFRTSYLSEGIEVLTGYRAEEMNSGAAPSLGELIHPDDLPEIERLVARGVARKEPFELEYRLRRKDGTCLWVHELGRAIFDAQGEPIWLDGVILDVTTRKELENQLQQAHKLRSLADVTGGVAHDFNNMLAGVLGYAELLRDSLQPGSESATWLDKLESSAQRAADLTRQMLAYTGRWLHRPEMINLSGHLERMLPMMNGVVGQAASLKLNLEPGLPTLLVDPAQLTQVALALVTNAAESLEQTGGEIAVTTGLAAMDRVRLARSYLYEDQEPGDYLFLEVSDTGEGFDDKQRDRLFDPFYTTKFTGRGMGLAVVLGIVRQHQGAIEVQSTPGQGTFFRVLLPVGARGPEQEKNQAAPARRDHSGITVMVVDDEASVLESTALWLENRGINVWRAGGGRQAIEVFQQSGDRVDAVLLDLTMPDLDGPQVVRELHAVRPELPIILASGYSESDLAARARDLGVDAFLSKPYDFKRLLETIIQVTRQD